MSDALVLCYHGVSERWPAEISIEPQRLESQLRYLLGKGYRGACFSEAVIGPAAPRTLAVTFDDGYRSVLELAFPILSRLGVPGTVFVPTAHVGGRAPMSWPGIDQWLPTPHRSELVCLSWDELAELRAAGWEIGSHTRSHPRLPELDAAAVDHELRESRAELTDRLGGPCTSLAYPFGEADRRVIKAARAAGYSAAAGLLPGPVPGPRRLAWPRVMVGRSDGNRRFTRRVTPMRRSLEASRAWPLVVAAFSGRSRAARAAHSLGSSRARGREPPLSESALRAVAGRGRLVRSRPAAVAGALLGRAGLLDAYTIWPEPWRPLRIVGAADRAAASWVRATFERDGRGTSLDAATWNALRARALLLPGTESVAVAAAALALSTDASGLRPAAVSPTGARVSKVMCFIFEREASEPRAVVKMMAEPGQAARLRREADRLETVRQRLADAPEAAAALPVAPLAAGTVRGEYAVVEPVDPLACGTGHCDRATALAWLTAFQAATSTGEAPWGPADDDAARELVADAWDRARPHAAGPMLERLAELSAPLRGERPPRCAVHGDYWRGNLALASGRLRVYDWEWAELEGRPLFDLWTYELADIRNATVERSYDPSEPLATAVRRVSAQLADLGIDSRFALATLAPAIAQLTFRIRRLTGRPGGNEAGSIRVMAAVERLLLA